MVFNWFFRFGCSGLRPVRDERGTTLLELIVTMGIATLFAGVAISNIMAMERPLISSSHEIAGLLKQARAKAIGTTNAYTVKPLNATTLIAQYGTSCTAATQTTDSRFTLELRRDITLTDTSWSVCYSPRGVASNSPTITVMGPDYASQQIEVFTGGAVRVIAGHSQTGG